MAGAPAVRNSSTYRIITKVLRSIDFKSMFPLRGGGFGPASLTQVTAMAIKDPNSISIDLFQIRLDLRLRR